MVGCWLVGWLIGWLLVGWLVGRLVVGWLVGWLVGLLVGWLDLMETQIYSILLLLSISGVFTSFVLPVYLFVFLNLIKEI